jgi:hypothetical protein
MAAQSTAMIHAPIGSGHWEPITSFEKQRGATLVRELAARMEGEVFSGCSMEDALIHALFHLAHAIYLEPTRDARCMLLYALLEQNERIHRARGCACMRGEDCDLDGDHDDEHDDEEA